MSPREENPRARNPNPGIERRGRAPARDDDTTIRREHDTRTYLRRRHGASRCPWQYARADVHLRSGPVWLYLRASPPPRLSPPHVSRLTGRTDSPDRPRNALYFTWLRATVNIVPRLRPRHRDAIVRTWMFSRARSLCRRHSWIFTILSIIFFTNYITCRWLF